MRRSPFRLFLGVFAITLLAVGGARADNVYGKIRGTVTDASRAAIPGVTVTALNTGTGVSYTATSGPDGSYEFLQLPAPATYDVSVEQTGFRSYQAKGINLLLDHTFVQNITLEIGTVTQQVTVEANSTQIADLGSGETVTMAPLIVRDRVIVGASGGELGI